MARRTTIIIPVAFTPANLSNLKLWVKSDVGVVLTSGKVSQWSDQSGNNNHLLQASASKRPTVVSADINGKDSILFDGSDDNMTASFTLAQPETVFLIYKAPTRTVDDYIFDGLNGGNTMGYEYYPAANRLLMYAGSLGPNTGTDELAANTYGLATCIFKGASSVLQINNNTQITGSAGTASPNGISLGGYNFGGPYFGNISVAELIIMSSAATATERANMKSYVTARYGITM